MKIEDIQPKPVVCRQSTIACAMACPRKWWYKYRMGFVLRGTQVKVAATLGTIYHRLQCMGPGLEKTVAAEIVTQQRELMEIVGRGEDVDGQAERLAGLLTELYNKAVAMSQLFWATYPQPSYFTVIGTEVKHSMRLGTLTLEGTIDKILLNEYRSEHPEVWIRDHKSTGQSLASIFGGVAWSLQARLYRLLVDDYIREYDDSTVRRLPPARGFILDGILKPGIKLCKTDEKNAKDWNVPITDAYLRRVKEWYKEKGVTAILSQGIIFAESIMPPELSFALATMEDLHRRLPRPERFDRDVTRRECFSYGTQCPYHDLCTTDPNQWDSLFETKYKIEEDVNEDSGEDMQDSDPG